MFLILVVLNLVEFAYLWKESWVANSEVVRNGDDSAPLNCWDWSYLITSLVFLGGSIVLIAFMFLWFTDEDTCSTQKFFISFTLILGVIAVFIATNQISGVRGGLLPASIVVFYCTYLCFTSLSSDPSKCNELQPSSYAQMIFGLAVACFSITFSAYSAANANLFDEFNKSQSTGRSKDTVKDIKAAASGDLGTGLSGAEHKGDHDSVALDTASSSSASSSSASSTSAAAKENEKNNDAVDDDDTTPASEMDPQKRLSIARHCMVFHLIMCAASMYMSMVLTNWSSFDEVKAENYGTDSGVDVGDISMWVKIISQWITFLVYIWVMLAPWLFPDRDWSS
eukprot:TRINITY_DN335_c0_g1_i1.p1 TRINITY_DN335_c0_g1~~TRINITY_DN335_c0_g1_i1.p1  ORF type:complete len:339 (-),score=76.89 TRINITY_DN335_c0_g1_i1:201-1217(-)